MQAALRCSGQGGSSRERRLGEVGERAATHSLKAHTARHRLSCSPVFPKQRAASHFQQGLGEVWGAWKPRPHTPAPDPADERGGKASVRGAAAMELRSARWQILRDAAAPAVLLPGLLPGLP